MSLPESPTINADSDATISANRPPLLAVVTPRISEAAALAGPLLHGAGPLIRAPYSSAPPQLRAALATMRRPDAPLVVATDSAATVRDTDRVHVADDGAVVESGTPSDLLEVPGVYAQHYGAELGANFAGRGKDVDDERRANRHSALRFIPTFATAPMIAVRVGDRVCYREFCPNCDAPVTIVDGECPSCGRGLIVV